jgi:hypothetical protein
MLQAQFILSILLIVGCSASMPSHEKSRNQIGPYAPVSNLKCKSGKDERVLEIKSTEAGGCELAYIKFGERKIIATSIQGLNHCEKVMQKTKSSLENSKFLCS